MKNFSVLCPMGVKVALIFILVSMFLGCTEKPKISLTTDYQAIFLDNGQAFFGKLENAGSPYPILTDVFYIQRIVNKNTNEVTNTLIKRGSEWHGPDRMYINARHIVLIEPVSSGSRVATLIKEAKTQAPNAGKQQLN
jgi:hypothetical protein